MLMDFGNSRLVFTVLCNKGRAQCSIMSVCGFSCRRRRGGEAVVGIFRRPHSPLYKVRASLFWSASTPASLVRPSLYAMPSVHPLWISLLVLVCLSGFCAAFGAGNIPSYAFLEGRAFRHGDIEDILSELLIRGVEVSSGVIGFAKKSAGKKFSNLNIKRTYFGNWLLSPDV